MYTAGYPLISQLRYNIHNMVVYNMHTILSMV